MLGVLVLSYILVGILRICSTISSCSFGPASEPCSRACWLTRLPLYLYPTWWSTHPLPFSLSTRFTVLLPGSTRAEASTCKILLLKSVWSAGTCHRFVLRFGTGRPD